MLIIQVEDLKNQVLSIDLTIPNNISIKKSDQNYSGQINSNYFLTCGLGTSATVSLLCAANVDRLINQKVDSQEIYKRDDLFENGFHGNSSGVDCESMRTGGPASFEKGCATSLGGSYISNYRLTTYDSGVFRDTKEIKCGSLNDRDENRKKLIKITEEAFVLSAGDFSLNDFI